MEDYVTFEQAVKFKELGFDWKVRACYRRKLILDDDPHYTEPKFVHNDTMGKRWTTNYNDNRCGGGTGKRYCSAPTLAQAQKWLREVKGIAVCVQSFDNNQDPRYGNFWWKEYFLPNCKERGPQWVEWWISGQHPIFPKYEEALSDGISKMLELIINK